MNTIEAIERRHSVRAYQDRPVETEKLEQLRELIERINREHQLNFQLVTNEPKAFSSRLAKYGKFENVKNYILLAAPKGEEEKVGYFGEEVVLEAQKLGLNTCWVGLTYKKVPGTYTLSDKDKIYCAIALGYGKTNGNAHTSKKLEELSNISNDSPAWFISGVKAASLAPTAVNQQRFHFELDNGQVKATAGRFPYTKLDLGIAKYHFEQGSGKDGTIWK